MRPISLLARRERLIFSVAVRLDDLQIERYSRQIVLREIGAAGQARLLDARVAIAGTGIAAERALGYLAAAGVGRLAAPRALHDAVDPGQRDVTLEDARAGILGDARSGATSAPFDALVVDGEDADSADAGPLPPARRTFWIAAGRAAEVPPCQACAATALPPLAAPPAELAGVRDALLGTVIATEVVKALLDVGTPLRGHVLTYDPDHASVTTAAVAARPGCVACTAAAAKG
jgi:hypothetical protein